MTSCDIMYIRTYASHHITAPPTLDLSKRDCLCDVSEWPNSGVVTLLATVLDLGSVAKALTMFPKGQPSRVLVEPTEDGFVVHNMPLRACSGTSETLKEGGGGP